MRRLAFESISATKSRNVFGKAINVMDREESHLLQSNSEQAATLRLMQKQSQAYYELTLLVRAIDALENWRQIEFAHLRYFDSKLPHLLI